MAITQTTFEIPEGESPQSWAEKTPGVYMNMIGLAGKNPVDGKYHFAPIKYSDVNLEGEKIKYGNGTEALPHGKAEAAAELFPGNGLL